METLPCDIVFLLSDCLEMISYLRLVSTCRRFRRLLLQRDSLMNLKVSVMKDIIQKRKLKVMFSPRLDEYLMDGEIRAFCEKKFSKELKHIKENSNCYCLLNPPEENIGLARGITLICGKVRFVEC
jgi:hypothetical protein